MTVRRATVNDVAELQDISRRTFVEAFAADNSEANMNKYVDDNFSIAQLTAELECEGTEFYFAEIDSEIAGYLKLNFGKAQKEQVDEQAMEIERIYILTAHQRQNIGQRLYEHAIERAQLAHASCIWLGVWEHNTRAMNFYKKNGFVPFGKHPFVLGNDEQTDILMKRAVPAK